MFDAVYALLFIITGGAIFWHSFLMLRVQGPDELAWNERLFLMTLALVGAAFLAGPGFGIPTLAICALGVWRPAAFGILGVYNPFANAAESWGDLVPEYLMQWWGTLLGILIVLLSAPQYPWVLMAFGVVLVLAERLELIGHGSQEEEEYILYLAMILGLSGFALLCASLWTLAAIAIVCYGFVFYVRLRWARESKPDTETA